MTFSLVPSNLSEAMEFSKLIAESELVPKDFRGKPSNVLVAVQMGAELGLAPMQALQGIAVINGRPCVWGDAMLAIVRGHPGCEGVREWIEGQNDECTAYCVIKRRGEPDEIIRKFSVADAKRAHLWDKEGTWKTYPQRMLQMRARSWACRDAFADALKGIYTAEEAQDIEPAKDMGPVDIVPTKNATEAKLAKLRMDLAPETPAAPKQLDDRGKMQMPPSQAAAGPDIADVIQRAAAAPDIQACNELLDLLRGLPEADRQRGRKIVAGRVAELAKKHA